MYIITIRQMIQNPAIPTMIQIYFSKEEPEERKQKSKLIWILECGKISFKDDKLWTESYKEDKVNDLMNATDAEKKKKEFHIHGI